METKGTLVIYLCAEDEEWILVPSGDETQNSYTRVIQESYSWDPNETSYVGERLTKHEIVSHHERRVTPSEWIVTEIESFGPDHPSKEFSSVVVAYCERQPLSPEEVEERSYVLEVKSPALA